jgi:small-conductance mechanosensitive channel
MLNWLGVEGYGEYINWDFWEPILLLLLNKSGIIFFIIIFTGFALKFRSLIIKRIFHFTKLQERQRITLEALLLSLTRYVIFIIAFLMTLSNLGADVAPIIASAGVIGLAIGFGAQTLVKDLITGFFIIFEDQFSVGDYVSINNGVINGTVIDVGLRATKIRTWAQHVVVIQNSEITISQNFNRDRMRAIVNVTVPYETEPALIEQAINSVASELLVKHKYLFLQNEQGQVLEAPQLYGITDVENNALGAKYTVISLVKDEHYWTACNLIRVNLLRELKEKGIKIAYPRRVELPEEDFNSQPIIDKV